MTAALWDDQALTLDDARRAVWAESDHAEGIDHCLRMITPALYHLTGVLNRRTGTADVLDLGAGIGRLAIPVARWHCRSTVWALDVSPHMLCHLATEARAGRLVTNVRPVLGDGQTLPAEIPTLTAAWSVVTFQHLRPEQQGRYVREVADRLEPGGVFRFQVVTDTEPGPLSHPVDVAHVSRWCAAAGLDVTDYGSDPRFPTWRWATAVKP